MLIPENTIEQVRESNDIVDVISEYVSLKKKGKNYVGLCPFHKEKTPSFIVHQDKQIYHCFGCGEGGNVISFIMKYRNLGFVDAVTMLAERANIVIPEKNSENSEKINLKEKLYKINREAAVYFYRNLQKSDAAASYFRKRGISPEIVKKFGLGYAPEGWDLLIKYLANKGFTPELMEQAGLIIKKDKNGYYDRFRNRVMFPVFDIKSRIIGFGGRVLDDSKPKYLNSPETLIFNKGYNLYGLNIASKNNIDRKIMIVEGYMDTIALHQFNVPNAVASLGTALTVNQAKLLKRYGDEVIICYDADTAGQAATLRGLDILSGVGCTVKILNIPKGKDPDEFIRAEGREAFMECINNAMPLVEYKIKRKTEKYDLSNTEGKIGFIKSCAEVLCEIDDAVAVDAYIGRLSSDTGISAAALYEEISRLKGRAHDERHINGNNRYNNSIDGQKLYLEPAYIKAERFILSILYNMGSYFDSISSRLSYEDFNDDDYRKIAGMFYEKLMNNETIVPAAIISSFDNNEGMKKAAGIFDMKINSSDNIEKMIDDYINQIHKCKLVEKKNTIMSQIKCYEEKGDVQKLVLLLRERDDIEKQLRML